VRAASHPALSPLLLSVLALPTPAPAKDADRTSERVTVRFELVSKVEVDCPDDRAVRSAVARRLGYDPFDDSAAELLSARITEQEGGLEGTVELRDETGQVLGRRKVSTTARDCVELAGALVLAVSIVLDPPAIPAAPEPAPEPTMTLLGRLGGHAALGAAPATSLGVTAGLVGRRKDRSLGIEARVDLPRSEEDSGGRIRTSSVIGLLSLCGHWRALGGCGTAGAGAIHASGEGFENAAAATRPLALAGPRLFFTWPVGGPVSLIVHADGMVALVQTNLRVGGDLVWSTPVFSGVLGAALQGRLW